MSQQPRDERAAGADVHHAVRDRERGRARLRAVTVTAGLAGLAAAGVIAANLPGPAHTGTGQQSSSGSSGSVSRGSSGDGSASGDAGSSGDGSVSDDGGSSGDGGAASVPGAGVGSAGNGGTSHATSGGS
jgi:hypothetical protein